jgi:hypothetical protein
MKLSAVSPQLSASRGLEKRPVGRCHSERSEESRSAMEGNPESEQDSSLRPE